MKRNNIRLFLLIFSACFLYIGASSQDSQLGNWLIYIGNKKLNDKWNWHHEVQYRNYNAIGDLEQLLLRTGIGHSLTDNSNLLLGYGFIHSENYANNSDEKIDVSEHRIFQQLITKQPVGSIKLQHRYRFEQRFIEDDFKLRFRYFLGVQVPLKGPSEPTGKWYLSAYNEIFLNSENQIFDRNRLFGGIGYRLSDHVRVELGYMNQFFTSSSRDQVNVLVFGSF